MKNKILLSACAVALGLSLLTSCKKSVDFDAICDDASEATLQGLFSGVEESEMTLHVVQYQFAKDGSVTRTTMEVGDGVYKAPATTYYSSWQLGDYSELKLGRTIYLNPADGGKQLEMVYAMGGVYEEGQPVALDKNDKIAAVPVTQAAIIDKKWVGNDTTFYRIDTTINVMKVDSIVYKHKEGKKYVIDSVHYDTTYVPTKMKWNVGPQLIEERRLELYRDPATNANTGKWYSSIKEFDYSKSRAGEQKLDSVEQYSFHWCFSDYSSNVSFEILAQQADGTEEYFDVKYDAKKPSMVIYKQELKVEEPTE